MSKIKKLNTLYIIGNGFDLHHHLDTWYSSFGLFLKKTYPDIYEVLLKYLGLADLDEDNEDSLKDPLWGQFEASLARMDNELLIENHRNYAPNYGSDDFSEGDAYAMQMYINEIVTKATLKMKQAFEEFIENVNYPETLENPLVNLDINALFLSFNYTDTLERYYKISRENIEYIHNKAGEGKGLILGHGIDPSEFEESNEQPPEDAKQRELWEEYMSSNYDHSLELAKDEIRGYFQDSFKPTQDVIAEKQVFFERLAEIDTVYVLGHSMSKVDLPYFIELKKYLSGNEEWVISYFNESEISDRKEVVMSLGIAEDKIHFKRISEL
jgi:hypothetical protein